MLTARNKVGVMLHLLFCNHLKTTIIEAAKDLSLREHTMLAIGHIVVEALGKEELRNHTLKDVIEGVDNPVCPPRILVQNLLLLYALVLENAHNKAVIRQFLIYS